MKNKDYSEYFNKRFYNWTTTDEIIIIDHKTRIKCICDCGIVKLVRFADLKSGKSKRCFSCGIIESFKEKRLIPLTKTVWHKIKQNAKVRNLTIEITIEDAYDKYLSQNKKCAYTGLELFFNSSSVKTDGNASLDRIDSSKGYVIDNIQWVHKKVNQIKMDLSHDDFIKLCHMISKNTKEPQDFDIENNIKSSNEKYYRKRNLCDCGNMKLKTSKSCKECYLLD